MRSTEHEIAVAFMVWWSYWSRSKKIEERLLWATPNGGHRHPAVARKLKAEGVRAGVSDYFLAVPRGGYHGLFLELKAEGGRASVDQLAFGNSVTEQGYRFCIARGADEASKAIESYLIRPTQLAGGND